MFGDNASTKIVGKYIVIIGNKKTKVKKIQLVEDLKNNLLIINQMCDQEHSLTFNSQECELRKEISERLVATTTRNPNNVYILNEIRKEKCCMGHIDETRLCHRRMGHMSFDDLVKVFKKQVVRDMPKIIKPSDLIFKQC